MTSARVDAAVASLEGTRRVAFGIGASILAGAAFQVAFQYPAFNFLVLVYAYLLIWLAGAGSARVAFRLGFLTGFLVFAPQLAWFWRIFGFAAVCLWAVLSVFTGLFVLSLWLWRAKLGTRLVWIAAPVMWMACEYFRSELYFLRFSWLSVGYAFSWRAGILPAGILGVYGCGFLIFLLAGLVAELRRRMAMAALIGLSLLLAMATSIAPTANPFLAGNRLHVAGIQLEFPLELKVPGYLDDLLKAFPDANVLVLSEYTFDGAIPKRVRDWCKEHRRYLIAGGKADVGEGEFYNTAFVVGPDGEVVFQQVKSVPIQFFKDGLPASSQKVWDSPWGKIAMCVCYDMSYRRVMDEFMRQGAQALIVPFMDVADWGEHQHELHAKVGSLRAQEYRIPIFRLGSSGISQLIESSGRVVESAAFAAEGAKIGGTMVLGKKARLPIDAWLAPSCVALTGMFLAYSVVGSVILSARKKRLKPLVTGNVSAGAPG